MNFMLFLLLPLIAFGMTFYKRKASVVLNKGFFESTTLLTLGLYPLILVFWSDHNSIRMLLASVSMAYVLICRFHSKILPFILFILVAFLFWWIFPDMISQRTILGIVFMGFCLFLFFMLGLLRLLQNKWILYFTNVVSILWML